MSDYETSMEFPSVDFPCVLCLQNIVKHWQERYLFGGKGKFNVTEELHKITNCHLVSSKIAIFKLFRINSLDGSRATNGIFE